MLEKVAVLVFDEVAPFELGVACEVFGMDRSADGFPRYEFNLCSVDGGPVRTRSGFTITPHADLTPIATADLVVVPAHLVGTPVPPTAIDALRAAWLDAGDLDEQRRICTELQMQLWQDVPYIPMGEYWQSTAYGKDLLDVKPGCFPVFWGIRRA